jgi:hypothetical protein
MSLDWEWISYKEHGWESILEASDAAYDLLLQSRVHATIRKTTDGVYFWRFVVTRPEDKQDPEFYASLTECQRNCEEALKVRQVEDALDGK